MKSHTLVQSCAVSLLALAAFACGESGKTSPSGSPASSAAGANSAGSAASAAGDAAMGGELDVKMDDKRAVKLKVGAAFVDLFPRDEDDKGKPGAYKFFIRVFNDGVKGATCETEAKGDKPVGGNDWALTFDTVNMDQWAVGSKDPLPISPAFFFKDASAPSGLAPWSSVSMTKNEVSIESFSEKQVTFKLDMANSASSGGDGHIKGKVTAKVCKIEK